MSKLLRSGEGVPRLDFTMNCAPFTTTAQQKGLMIAGKGGPNAYIQHFKKKSVKTMEDVYSMLLDKHVPDEPFEGPIDLTIELHFPMPKSRPKWYRCASQFKTTKPDVDNAVKSLVDCMTASNFWSDDSEVSAMHLFKMETIGAPRIRIIIEELPIWKN